MRWLRGSPLLRPSPEPPRAGPAGSPGTRGANQSRPRAASGPWRRTRRPSPGASRAGPPPTCRGGRPLRHREPRAGRRVPRTRAPGRRAGHEGAWFDEDQSPPSCAFTDRPRPCAPAPLLLAPIGVGRRRRRCARSAGRPPRRRGLSGPPRKSGLGVVPVTMHRHRPHETAAGHEVRAERDPQLPHPRPALTQRSGTSRPVRHARP